MPAAVRRLTAADFRVMPWANGRGTTLELCREDDADGLLWRLSIADVVEPGAFSPLPGVDRVLTLIEGPGFDLDFGPHGRASLAPFAPVAFSGDWPTRAENVRGASRDFNLMSARDRARAALAIHRAGPLAGVSADRTFLLALAGAWRLAVAGETLSLAAGELAVLAGAGTPWRAAGTGVLAAGTVALAAPAAAG